MAKNDRLDAVRRVRSLNDLTEITALVRKDLNNSIQALKNLTPAKRSIRSLAAQRLGFQALAANEEDAIELLPGRFKRISTKGRKSKVDALQVKLDKFVAPPAAKIQKNLKIVQELHDNAKELDALEAMLEQTFRSAKNHPAALKAVRALRVEVDGIVHNALELLNTIAAKHIPDQLQDLRDRVVEYLLDTIDASRYEDIGYSEYVTLPDSNTVQFSVYIDLDELKNDRGYVFDEYFIVLTALVDVRTKSMEMYVNSMPDFRVPGKYPLGQAVTSQSNLEQRISMLLAHNDLITTMDRSPMPISGADAQAKFGSIKGVIGVEVKDDSLMVQVAKQDKAANTRIASEVTSLLNGVMRRKKDSSISWKETTVGGKKYLKFILYFKPGSAPKSLNTGKMNELIDLFDLSKGQQDALRRSLLD